ncbi:MAG: S41 family peptidase, partial [Phycisphaerales bacterium]|nr:S41 family peptidase [Phycisphaerales bacterium]
MKRFVGPALLVVLIGSLLIRLPMAIADRTGSYSFFDPIVEVYGLLNSQFVSELDDDAQDDMQLRMIEAAVDSLGDPYTTYVPAANTDDFNKIVRGEYVGIGAEVNIINDYLTIVTPMDDSPALNAGLRAGDVVLEIEGESTYQLSIDDCIDRLMGKPNTDVRVKVRHENLVEQEITITRRPIFTPTVKGIRRNGEHWNYCIDSDLGLAYIRVTQFNANTVDELQAALRDIQQTGLNGLVLDLRDNPGGALNAAVGMADLFLDHGSIVTVKPRQGRDQSFSAHADGTLPYFPMVVLINDSSASASEIVSGALQDNGRAKVLGMRSFGKGSVQEIRPLRYGRGTLKITTAEYYLPSGRNINRKRNSDATVWGVDPDPGMIVPMTDDERIEMLRARRDFEIIRAPADGDGACATLSWIRETLKDEQLAKAIEALQGRLDGAWPSFGDQDAGDATFAIELDRQYERRRQLLEALLTVDTRIGELANATDEELQLVPKDADLVDGTIELRDKYGNIVGTYR